MKKQEKQKLLQLWSILFFSSTIEEMMVNGVDVFRINFSQAPFGNRKDNFTIRFQ